MTAPVSSTPPRWKYYITIRFGWQHLIWCILEILKFRPTPCRSAALPLS